MTKPLAKTRPQRPRLLASERLKIAPESLYAIAEELPPILARYGAEFGKAEVVPDWPNLFRMTANGTLRTVTARDEGLLVGFVTNIVGPHLLYRTTIHGITTSFWLDPLYRHGWTGLKFLAKNKEFLREWGVRRACIAFGRSEDARRDDGMHKLFKRLGYEFDEASYAMRL